MRLFISYLWFLILCILFQIWLGGVTRLTESGLSITEWDLFAGVVPPTNNEDWDDLFELYKQSPQYEKINQSITIEKFKFIFFWEYIHRLWGRFAGLIVLLASLFFTFRWGFMDREKTANKDRLIRRSWYILLGFVIVGSFGWIMVASGLKDRPWVNAYYLSMHLSLAAALLFYVIETQVLAYRAMNKSISNKLIINGKWLTILLVVSYLQFFLGGMIAGMRAAMFYPTFPLMNGELIPSVLLNFENWSVDNFVFYDDTLFMSALVQFCHRFCAFFLLVWTALLTLKVIRSKENLIIWKRLFVVLFVILMTQVLLGIITVLYSIGEVPVAFGSLHQMIGVIFVSWLTLIVLLRRHWVIRI